jgi:hypothetical protein
VLRTKWKAEKRKQATFSGFVVCWFNLFQPLFGGKIEGKDEWKKAAMEFEEKVAPTAELDKTGIVPAITIQFG